MVEQCLSLNFLKNRSITDTFDGYVVLAFFLALIITIVIVLCMVKYVTYNLQRDREREQIILKRQLNKPKRIEEIPEESDDEFIWSDNEEESQPNVDIKTNAVDNETISLCSNYDTNYVGHFPFERSNSNEEDNKSHNDITGLLMQLQLDKNIESNSPCEILIRRYVLPDSKEPCSLYTFSLLSFYNNCIFKIAAFRKIAFSQTVDFTIDFLCSLHVLPEDKALSLKTKYEQKLEKLSYGNPRHNKMHAVVNHGKQLQVISQHFIDDLDNMVENKQMITQVRSCLQSGPLDMLKLYMSSLLGLHEHYKDYSAPTIHAIKICDKLFFTIKSRYYCFRESISKQNANSVILEEFVSNISEVFKNLKSQFSDALNKLKQLHLLSLDNEKQSNLKLEEDITLIKLDILNSEDSKVEEKLTKFNDMMVAFIVSHFEESNDNLLLSIHQQLVIIKKTFSELQKDTFLRMTEVEETTLMSLKNKCNASDKKILSIVQNVQDSLKSSVQNYQEFVNKSEASTLEVLEKSSYLVHLFIEYTIKSVSLHYRKYLTANAMATKTWPSTQEQLINKILLQIQWKLSTEAFDIVLALIHRIFISMLNNQTLGTITVSEIDTNSLYEDILNVHTLPDIQNHTFLKNSKSMSVLPSFEQFLETNLRDYNDIIVREFDEVTLNLHKEIKENFIASVNPLFFENILIYSNMKKTFSRPESSKKTDKKSSKYLSRKRSSFKEKTQNTKLADLYKGLLDVKEHKYEEKCKQILLELHNRNSVKSGANFVIKYLNKQLDLLQMSHTEAKIKALFTLEQYYMKQMFMKKMKQLEEDGEGKPSPQVKQNPIKSTIQKSSSKSSFSTAKISMLPTKRKSRKVADSFV